MIDACKPTLYAGLIVHSAFTRIVPMIHDSTHHTITQQQLNHQACEQGPDHKRVDATTLRQIAALELYFVRLAACSTGKMKKVQHLLVSLI